MLRTLFHLASKVECRSENKIWVRIPDLVFGVVSLDIYLCRSNRLLPDRHPFGKFDKLYLTLVVILYVSTYRTLIEVYIDQTWIW